jgi:hypothetical protein
MRLLGPGTLRVGGNSVDDSWWTSDDEQTPAWAKSVVTPADLDSLHSLLVAAGWRTILGVDLGHFDPTRAASEASFAKRILGSSLLGFEIGNEPNAYGGDLDKLRPQSYSVSDYLDDVAAYSAAIGTAAPGLRLYGPDLSSSAWLPAITSDKPVPFTTITEHYYPTKYSVSKGACEGTPTPTAPELLSPYIRERESAAAQAIVKVGQIEHREVRISETNDTSSCDVAGGPATSPVFASALWSLDWILRSASAGVAGLNFHGDFGLCPPNSFSPVCAPDKAATAQGRVIARPEYYGLLAARQLEGGRFVPTRLIASGPLPDIMTWATLGTNRTLKIVIESLATEGSAQPVSIPISGYVATYETLVGPSVGATTGIALGGRSLTSAGQWRPRSVKPSRAGHSLRIVVSPASAIIVTMRPKRSRG